MGIQARDASRSLLFPTHPLAKLEHLWEETRLLRGWGWMEQHDASRLQRGSTEVSAEVQGPPIPKQSQTLFGKDPEEEEGGGKGGSWSPPGRASAPSIPTTAPWLHTRADAAVAEAGL